MNVDKYIGGIEKEIMNMIYQRLLKREMKVEGNVGVDEKLKGMLKKGMVVKEN